MCDEDVIDVMLGAPGTATWNTIVLADSTVVVPLDRDLDGDPEQDDEVWLATVDGRVVRRLLSSDDDVTEDPDTGLLHYHFRGVPFGLFGVWMRVGGCAVEIARDLVVRRGGVFLGGQALPVRPSGAKQAGGAPSSAIPEAQADLGVGGAGSQETVEYVDQADEEPER